ncbi:MAG: hypothetical protein ABSE05_17260 [Syntrophales bacterium]|jgi:hypothetical protein
MKLNRMIAGITIAFAIPYLSGCWFAAAAGAGAAGGYEAKKEGYGVQSPITKEKGKKESSKDSKTDSEKSDTE